MTMLLGVASGWLFEPSITIGVLVAALLYVLGIRTILRAGLARRLRWWRPFSYLMGLITLVIALESPLDELVDQLLWAHMLQHVLLVFTSC